MADRLLQKGTGAGMKPVPMKLFASWEVEKTSPNCIPRLCILTLNRLVVLKPLENDLNSVIVAVKMQSFKRVLRSNEIMFPPSGLLDTELDLTFSLQYPHFLKRDGNKLQIMLQRRKKYKNRTILGYKTLAMGQISMSQVLQRSVDRELNMYSDLKERTTVVAQLLMVSLSSQPVDHEENDHRKQTSSDVDRSPDVDNYSDDDEPYNDQEYWSNDDMSDSEPMMMNEARPRPRKSSRGQIRPRQRNIKQKFIALLKRFKVSEEALDSEADHELGDTVANPADIDELIDELEDLSDSGPELDTLSVISTPKPRLRPFFTGRTSTTEADLTKETEVISDDNTSRRNDSDNLADRETDPDSNENLPFPDVFTGKPKSPLAKKKMFGRQRSISYREAKTRKNRQYVQRRNSTGITDGSPRKILLEQLSSVLECADDRLPGSLFLVNTAEWQGQLFVQKLQEKEFRLICTCSNADVKAAINFLVTRIQKFCNSSSKNPGVIKVGIAGGDRYINTVLGPYVEQFSARSPDWQNYVRFLVIPLGVSMVGKQLAGMDNTYSSLFLDTLWKDTFDKPDSTKLDQQEVINRVSKYLRGATGCAHIAVSEAMIMYKNRSTDEETSQIFIPFLSDVLVGVPESINTSVDLEEGTSSPPSLSSSPPSSAVLLDKQKEGHTPPSSPNVGVTSPIQGIGTSVASNSAPSGEYLELQVDYWATTNKPEGVDKGDKSAKKDGNKLTLKSTFKSLHVHRAPYWANPLDNQSLSFSMTVIIKEKKQKIMRLGKKAKEMESKSQLVESITRLLCTSKSQSCLLKVMVDGVEWSGVKFFQLSSQWQTHIKHFPVAMFIHPDAYC
ncbi:hypothetical protein ScPMuIL_013504 [Solemya velum]